MTAERPMLNLLEIGGGRVSQAEGISLTIPATASGYADAQVDDHRQLKRADFQWRPPLRLRLQARTDVAEPVGTLGFGFWNDPFALSLGQAGAARKLPASPNALWFFYGSEPNQLALAAGAPQSGWKASSLRTPRLPSWLLALPALAAFALSYLPGLRRPVVKSAKAFVAASEAGLSVPLNEWHQYQLEWTEQVARFWVDSELVLLADRPARGPLGFVAWIDNQFAQVSSQHGIRFGVLPTGRSQTLEIRQLTIERAP